MPALQAQEPKRGFDCSRTQDPKGCEERMAQMRAARDKARKACEGKSGEQRRECMEKAFCAQTSDPAKCQAMQDERMAKRRQRKKRSD